MNIGNDKEVRGSTLVGMIRREFFKRAAIVAAGTAGVAVRSEGAEPTPEWKGMYDRSMAVYGNIKLKDLFTKRLSALQPELQANIDAATTAGTLTGPQASAISEVLQGIIDQVSKATVKKLFTQKIEVDLELAGKIFDVNANTIWLAFCLQKSSTWNGAKDALDEDTSKTDTLVHGNHCGKDTLKDLYTKTAGDLSAKHVLAVTKGKKGGIFGPHPLMYATRAEFAVNQLNLSGSSKPNDLVCESGTCEPCDEFFCTIVEGGGCSVMSDPGPCALLEP
ncbi:MAG: hypothetical protein HUU46_03365 [Candidatus Hydrogenedentes bacterium]|nr:hypothetical protein [Candidatus Hydrogenedentota bacterium]